MNSVFFDGPRSRVQNPRITGWNRLAIASVATEYAAIVVEAVTNPVWLLSGWADSGSLLHFGKAATNLLNASGTAITVGVNGVFGEEPTLTAKGHYGTLSGANHLTFSVNAASVVEASGFFNTPHPLYVPPGSFGYVATGNITTTIGLGLWFAELDIA